MTDQDPFQGTPPAGDPGADEPIPEAPPEGAGRHTAAPGREWLAQLEAMIQQISTQAAPVARQVGAKAAELAAIAAAKAGPVAQKAAELTTDYGQRFAEKAQSVAAELRSQDAHAPDGDGPASAAADAPGEPAPEDTTATGL